MYQRITHESKQGTKARRIEHMIPLRAERFEATCRIRDARHTQETRCLAECLNSRF
jgi:hypothetical protein